MPISVNFTPSTRPDSLRANPLHLKEVFKIGDAISYPLNDHGFYILCDINEDAARLWLDTLEICVSLKESVSSSDHLPPEDFENRKDWDLNKYANNQWINKVAFVVGFDYTHALALYKHDGKIHVIIKYYHN